MYESQTVSYHSLAHELVDEGAYRADQASWGAIDLHLAATGAMALGTVGELVQTERDALLVEHAELQTIFPDADISSMMIVDPYSQDPFMLLASLPLDLKAAAVAAGAFAAVSAAGRIRRHIRFPRDARKIIDAYGTLPIDEGNGRHSRILRRLGDAAVTSVATVGAYHAAKYGNQMQDVIAAGALSAAAVGSVYVSQFRTWKARRGWAKSSSADLVA